MPVKSNTEEFIKKSKIKHGDLYDYSKVEYNGRDKPVLIICKKHGVFSQTPHDHLSGCGCPKCYYERKSTPKISFEEFEEKANKKHNYKYAYIKNDYKGISSKIRIICPEHGEFIQTPQRHLCGQGCPICGNAKKGLYQKGTTDSFIRKSMEIHGTKYDYSKVEYINNRIKVCIICPEHGEFYQKPLDHLHGCGCPECGRKLNRSEKIVLNALIEKYGKVEYQYKEPWLQSKTSFSSIDFYLPDYKIGIEYQGRQHFIPLERFGGENGYLLQSKRDLAKYINCMKNGIKMFYVSFEKEIPNNYFSDIYNSIESLINAIDGYIKTLI